MRITYTKTQVHSPHPIDLFKHSLLIILKPNNCIKTFTINTECEINYTLSYGRKRTKKEFYSFIKKKQNT